MKGVDTFDGATGAAAERRDFWLCATCLAFSLSCIYRDWDEVVGNSEVHVSLAGSGLRGSEQRARQTASEVRARTAPVPCTFQVQHPLSCSKLELVDAMRAAHGSCPGCEGP